MGIGDRLLAKTANVSANRGEGARQPAGTEARTSPGRLMEFQGRLNDANAKIAALQEKIAEQSSLELPLEALVEIPGRRRHLSDEQFAELKSNLERHPLLTPILVRKLESGQFEIIAGHNRVAVFRELGRPTIMATIAQFTDDATEYAAFFSNLLSPSLPDFEKYWNFRRLEEMSNLTRAEIAANAGLSTSHVSRIFSYDGLPEEARTLLAKRPDVLGSTAASKLAALTDNGKRDKVIEAISLLVNESGLTQEQAVAFAAAKEKTKKTTFEPIVIRAGKKKLCEVSARGGIVGVRFFAEQQAHSDEWAKRISDFVEATIKERNED